jgi:hypothetical protein
MRLYEISKYDPRVYRDPQTDKIVRFILDHCSEWLRAAGVRTVWRGVKNYGDVDPAVRPDVFTRKVRTRRRVRDSNPKYHALYNQLIRLAGGTANRTNSMFVVGNRHQAGGYGATYAVFPIGPFTYTWSPVWEDWYTTHQEDIGYEPLFDLMKPEIVKKIESIPSAYGKNLPEFYSESFPKYLFNINSYDPVKVKQTIAVNRNLDAAIDSQHEIMIQCSEALYIKEDYYRDVIYQTLVTVVDHFPS